ncbi:Epsin-3, clathrin recruitment and traffic between the Golgi and endosome [Entophlyctis luteolus]|nr:Epsin-3, clathrin recruitment and traffic between the Golgi and endosome [Entophlyctis luteolus]
MEAWLDLDKINATFNKLKNAVLNLPEYQVKVLEATGPEHWGASSTLMLDIANATGHPQHFNDIMKTLYDRIQEPPSATWRQTYKALQLLEYLIKNGTERVVDYAKDRIYDLKGLKRFLYVDDKGKDQGINVRNRAEEIIALLGDNQRIREERKKAKENRSKYTGVSSSGSQYGGFAGGMSSSISGFSGNGFSSRGGGGGGGGGGGFRDDDYDRSDDAEYSRSGNGVGSAKASVPASVSANNRVTRTQPQPVVESAPTRAPPKMVFKSDGLNGATEWKSSSASAVKPPETTRAVEADLLGVFSTNQPAPDDGDEWGEFTSATTAAPSSSNNFADFSSAFAGQQSAPAATNANAHASSLLDDFGDFASALPATSQAQPSAGFADFSMFQSGTAQTLTPVQPAKASFAATSSGKQAAPDLTFSRLVSLDASALSGLGKKAETAGPSLSTLGMQQHMQPQWGLSGQGVVHGGAGGFGGARGSAAVGAKGADPFDSLI